MTDPDVLAWATRNQRTVLTFDKDFGELVDRFHESCHMQVAIAIDPPESLTSPRLRLSDSHIAKSPPPPTPPPACGGEGSGVGGSSSQH
jgi:Domain of unknown function (DUF5615)